MLQGHTQSPWLQLEVCIVLLFAYTSLTLSSTEQSYPWTLQPLMASIHQPHLKLHIRWYLWPQEHPGEALSAANSMPVSNLPHLHSDLKINVYHSAVIKYYAPSNLGGVGGMVRQRI
jgi:hypothetical protein